MPPSLRRWRVFSVLLFLGLIASACSSNAAQNGVNVKTVATNLTYGVPKTPAPAEPANQAPVPPNPLPVKVVFPLPSDLPPIYAPPANPCPTAPPTVFPSAAPSDVSGRPAAGSYLWRVAGSQKTAIGTITLQPTSPRIVDEVMTTSEGFSFRVTERELVYGSTYNVRTTYEYHATGNQAQSAGLYLTKIERLSRRDPSQSSTFSPTPAVLIFPTPAIIGTQISSVGIDPTSLEVLQVTGSISQRKHVDACGTPIDTFYVRSMQKYTAGNTSTTREFDYGIATGLGGLPVLERIESPCTASTSGSDPCQTSSVTFHMDTHIGQLKPSAGS